MRKKYRKFRVIPLTVQGTGKTFASAFAMRELGFKRVLFLVHRGQLARQTKKAYQKIFNKSVSMGLVGSGYQEYNNDYVFATIQTLNKEEHLYKYAKKDFDCIILDEAHHSSADTYQKVMQYFDPKLWLGMTATPDKRNDEIEGKNIYQIFNYQIAYEIRLQQAMEENLLCPFHYFGISDISLSEDENIKGIKIDSGGFNQLISDERVRHIIDRANYFGYSGEKVKGLVFCSRIDETKELSTKFNLAGFRTIALNGDASEEARVEAFERLAMNEEDATSHMQPLDYIFSVEILNEGIDIVEVNQVIMLRPTESPIVFIQQLGRGLRKSKEKEYVVILDFIGNCTIPGASTIHFDEIAKDRIFESISKIKGMKSIIKERYIALKNRLGRIPRLVDFYDNGEIDPMVIIKEYRTYQSFLEQIEKDGYCGKVTEEELLILEYLSKTILCGIRPYELEILNQFLCVNELSVENATEIFRDKYGLEMNMDSYQSAINVLKGNFVAKKEEYAKYSHVSILTNHSQRILLRMEQFQERLKHVFFQQQLEDIIEVGIKRYKDKYSTGFKMESGFILYEKYSRRDVSLLMNCERDLSSTMYGMKRIKDDVFIFVTYHKEGSKDEEKSYLEGKPDYADAFEDNIIFQWDSQIGRAINSTYVQEVVEAKNKHLLVKKSDAETNFYYMGQFDIIDKRSATKKDIKGKMRVITKFRMKNNMKTIKVVAAVIRSVNVDDIPVIFATQRGTGEFKGGWEFPGGKVEEGETKEQALIREIKEELATEIMVGTLIQTIEYDYPTFHLTMDCFWCEIINGNLVLKEHLDAKWLTKDQLDSVEWLPADIELVDQIKQLM